MTINNYCWRCCKEVAATRSIIYEDEHLRDVGYRCPICYSWLDFVNERIK